MAFNIGVHSDCTNCPTSGNFTCRLNREIRLACKHEVAIASVSRYYQSNENNSIALRSALSTPSTYVLEKQYPAIDETRMQAA